jgi:8-oxo-dGTP pyrophosphatase MutT (NUDIX family)
MSDMPADRNAAGYRVDSAADDRSGRGLGPKIRSDVVDVYIVRTAAENGADSAFNEFATTGNPSSPADVELLQLQRSRDPLRGTWQPVMGHIEPGETAVQAALRETQEETGLVVDLAALKRARETGWTLQKAGGCLGMWALEQVHPFYIAAIDCIVLSPRFVVLVDRQWLPILNAEHTASRWVSVRSAGTHFTWPGQLASIAELRTILNPAHPGHTLLRL